MPDWPSSKPDAGDRVYLTERRQDPSQNPPRIIDEPWPTVSVTLRGPLRRGRVRAPAGTIAGSYYLTGSHRQLGAPGTYSLRITRVSIATGSRETGWFIRHSRLGTKDVVYFPTPGHYVALGSPREPVYAFGSPGTVIYGFLEAGSGHFLSQHMEGFVT